MKQRGAEVTYRIRNNKDKHALVRPWSWAYFFFFISCLVNHNDMSLIPLIWWIFFDFFTLKIKKKYWMVTKIGLPFSSIQGDWMSTERSRNSAWNPDFSEHSVSIQWTFRNVSVEEFSSCEGILMNNQGSRWYPQHTGRFYVPCHISQYPYYHSFVK